MNLFSNFNCIWPKVQLFFYLFFFFCLSPLPRCCKYAFLCILYSLVLNLQVGKLPLSTSSLPDDPCISTVGKTYPQSILTQTHVPEWRCSHPVHGVQIRAECLYCPVNITSVHGFHPFGEPSCHLFYNFLLQRDLLLALGASAMLLPAQLIAAFCWTPEPEIVVTQSIVSWPVFITSLTSAFEPVTWSKCFLPECQGSVRKEWSVVFWDTHSRVQWA